MNGFVMWTILVIAAGLLLLGVWVINLMGP